MYDETPFFVYFIAVCFVEYITHSVYFSLIPVADGEAERRMFMEMLPPITVLRRDCLMLLRQLNS